MSTLSFIQFLQSRHVLLSPLGISISPLQPPNAPVNGSCSIMADHAVSTQLPSMVRNPKAVWPGLVKMGMYQKQIAGDGMLLCCYQLPLYLKLTSIQAIVCLHPFPINSTAHRQNTPRYVQASLSTCGPIDHYSNTMSTKTTCNKSRKTRLKNT